MQNINADENTRLLEAAGNIVEPVLEAGNAVEAENILSVSSQASNAGLATVPVTPALASAR